MDELLERARKSLNISLSARQAASGQAHALDSIAASLLYIAHNMNSEPAQVTDDQIELVVRRLLDNAKASAKRSKK